ncbi:MAG: ATP-binding protein [Phormidesmis sp.]
MTSSSPTDSLTTSTTHNQIDEKKALSRSNRILQKRIDRSERARAEMEVIAQQREQMLKAALQKAEADRAQLAEAKAQLTQLNLELETRIQAGVAALHEATDNLQQAKVQVVKSEKFSTLGELVAGVAHEINNPIGCITSNVKFVADYGQQLLEHIALQQAALAAHQPHTSPALEKIENHAEDIDLAYITEDFPKLVASMATSGDRIKAISQSLRTFARADTSAKQSYNLHQGIDGTLLILRHRLKAVGSRPAITVRTQYGQIPQIDCYPGQINQVFMNIIANAIDAMEEGASPSGLPEISITTALENRQVIVIVQDNAGGMSESVRTQIFDSQFTTKTADKGTGLGLSIAHQIVTDTHQGQIECLSTLGIGTTFRIALPAG